MNHDFVYLVSILRMTRFLIESCSSSSSSSKIVTPRDDDDVTTTAEEFTGDALVRDAPPIETIVFPYQVLFKFVCREISHQTFPIRALK
jgi:hypothetical protein